MPMVQGGYLADATDLREGMVAMMGVTTDQLSGVNGLGLIFPYGRGVVFGASTKGTHENSILVLPTTAGQVIRGVTPHTDKITQTRDAFGNWGYPPAGAANVTMMSRFIRGYIAVRAIENVIAGDSVSCLITVGADQGKFGKTVDATRLACPTHWAWATTTALGAIGLLYLP